MIGASVATYFAVLLHLTDALIEMVLEVAKLSSKVYIVKQHKTWGT